MTGGVDPRRSMWRDMKFSMGPFVEVLDREGSMGWTIVGEIWE